MAYNLDEAMNRLPPLEKAAMLSLSTPVTCDAVEYWPYQQETFPYWWNRIESMEVENIFSQDIELHRYTVSMALVIAHLDAGYRGETAEKAYTWIVGVLDYFRQHMDLVSSTYTDPLTFLWIQNGGARITGIPNGTRALANSGMGAQQIALVFTLDLPLIFELY